MEELSQHWQHYFEHPRHINPDERQKQKRTRSDGYADDGVKVMGFLVRLGCGIVVFRAKLKPGTKWVSTGGREGGRTSKGRDVP